MKKHDNSEFHKESLIALANYKKTSVIEHISNQKQSEMTSARTALLKIFSTIHTLAQQGLAIRGNQDENSNLLQFLKMRAEDSTELQAWLNRSTNRKWLHHDIINEILHLMANKVLKEKLKLIKSLKIFSIIMDETADNSRLEQISLCARIVLEDLTIQEIFLGFYQTDDTKAETLFKILQDVLIRYDLSINNLRGQCYDGASNMSGKITGLQTRVLEVEPRALYVHCSAHSLNLVVQDALENVTSARNFIGFAKEIINFIRDSPKRLYQFKTLQSKENRNLTPYCPTR